MSGRSSETCLYERAEEQLGHFTSTQARACGYSWEQISYHTKTGRFLRRSHGVYRLRDFPYSPREYVMEAWLASGGADAVVSHESALDLHELSDIIPSAVHLTVPRSRRFRRSGKGVTIHTVGQPIQPDEIVEREGLPVTSILRTLLDTAKSGIDPYQFDLALRQALDRGQILRSQIENGPLGALSSARWIVDPILAERIA